MNIPEILYRISQSTVLLMVFGWIAVVYTALFLKGGHPPLSAIVGMAVIVASWVLGSIGTLCGLGALRGQGFEAGLHALAFLDVGTAWANPRNRWDNTNQRFATDAGVGLASSEDDVRVYVARDLSDSDADFVWSVRLRRPF